MQLVATAMADVYWLESPLFTDERGCFQQVFQAQHFAELTGFSGPLVQDNYSLSKRHVLRGLHYQLQQPQGKLLRLLSGEIYDVVVDLRQDSAQFGQWLGLHWSADQRQLWIPPGFAHGFLVLSEQAELMYKTTDYYHPAGERCIKYNDPTLAIQWPLSATPILSGKDQNGQLFATADYYR